MQNGTLELALTDAQQKVAMSSPEHLKTWLSETGRDYIVFRAVDLVDSLKWPNGVMTFMSIIDAYRAHRREQVVEKSACPQCSKLKGKVRMGCTFCGGVGDMVTRTKTDVLEPEEIDAAIAHLTFLRSEMLEKRGSGV